jgi:hypothetical protein
MHRPIFEQTGIETWKSMYIDWAVTESGDRVAVRYYWPKSDFEYAVVRNAFDTLTNARRKELARLKELYSGYLGV